MPYLQHLLLATLNLTQHIKCIWGVSVNIHCLAFINDFFNLVTLHVLSLSVHGDISDGMPWQYNHCCCYALESYSFLFSCCFQGYCSSLGILDNLELLHHFVSLYTSYFCVYNFALNAMLSIMLSFSNLQILYCPVLQQIHCLEGVWNN